MIDSAYGIADPLLKQSKNKFTADLYLKPYLLYYVASGASEARPPLTDMLHVNQ